MNRIAARTIAWCLVGSLLLLSGLMYPLTVPHAVHHAHHNAATHATVLCNWMCAAGQGLEGVAFGVQSPLGPVFLAGLAVHEAPPSPVLPAFSSRGPPPRVV